VGHRASSRRFGRYRPRRREDPRPSALKKSRRPVLVLVPAQAMEGPDARARPPTNLDRPSMPGSAGRRSGGCGFSRDRQPPYDACQLGDGGNGGGPIGGNGANADGGNDVHTAGAGSADANSDLGAGRQTDVGGDSQSDSDAPAGASDALVDTAPDAGAQDEICTIPQVRLNPGIVGGGDGGGASCVRWVACSHLRLSDFAAAFSGVISHRPFCGRCR